MVVTHLKQFDNKNAENYPGVVFIDPDIPYFAAVWAQECYEAEWKLNPFHLVLMRFSKSARRDMEVVGHEIEVQAAVKFYDADEGTYRRAEAESLADHYDDFKGMKVGSILKRMRRRKGKAQSWVENNLRAIRAQKQEADNRQKRK